MEDLNICTYKSAEALNIDFAAEIAAKLQQAVNENGKASLLLSGGSTPKPMLLQLSLQQIDWQKVYVSLVDERWVEVEDANSNEKMVRESLLINEAAKCNFIGMSLLSSLSETDKALPTTTNALLTIAEVKAKLEVIPKPFDVVVLGMGEDGHTASIFPCCEQLEEAQTTDETLMVTEPTTAPYQRITFTKSALLKSKQLYLHLVGIQKKQVLEEVMATDDEKKAPIIGFLKQTQVPMKVMLAENK